MELSEVTLKGLNLLKEIDLISDETFQSFVELTSQKMIHPASSSAATSVDFHSTAGDTNEGILKEVGAALSTLFIEAAKHDSTPTDLVEALEENADIPDERLEFIAKKYEETKPKLRSMLGSIGRHFATVTEAGWKLDYVVKTNLAESYGEARFSVTLSGPTEETVRFVCTTEQLQDLVAKLKNACKSLDRISAQSS